MKIKVQVAKKSQTENKKGEVKIYPVNQALIGHEFVVDFGCLDQLDGKSDILSKLALKNGKIACQSKCRAVIRTAQDAQSAQIDMDALAARLTLDTLLGRQESPEKAKERELSAMANDAIFEALLSGKISKDRANELLAMPADKRADAIASI